MDQSDIAVQGRNTFRNAVHGLFKSMIDVVFLFYSSNTQFQPGLPTRVSSKLAFDVELSLQLPSIHHGYSAFMIIGIVTSRKPPRRHFDASIFLDSRSRLVRRPSLARSFANNFMFNILHPRNPRELASYRTPPLFRSIPVGISLKSKLIPQGL
jgi:hypothetical protein